MTFHNNIFIKILNIGILNNEMKLNFVTKNKGKVKEFKVILKGICDVEQIEMDYKELRSDNPEDIAKLAAKQLAEKLNKTVIVEDSGLFIKALKDFPGTSSSYIHKRIGLKGILKLMENVEDRSAIYKSAVAYCEPGHRPISFLGAENGRISEKIEGPYGFGHDPIFIPEGLDKTYGTIANVENVKKFRKRAVLKLIDHLKKSNKLK